MIKSHGYHVRTIVLVDTDEDERLEAPAHMFNSTGEGEAYCPISGNDWSPVEDAPGEVRKRHDTLRAGLVAGGLL